MADQLGAYYSALRKSFTWFKKIAVDMLFQVAVVNAMVIYNEENPHKKMTLLQVQEILIRHFLGEGSGPARQQLPPSRGTTQHKLTQIPRKDDKKIVRKRCNICYKEERKKKPSGPIKSNFVDTECKPCGKAYCLPCYNKSH